MPSADFVPLQLGPQLGSMIHFQAILRLLIDAQRPPVICEIGIESGIVTDQLLNHAARFGGRYVGIDPMLSREVRASLGTRDNVQLCETKSVDALQQLHDLDFVIVDGDHNYETVHEELRLLIAMHRARPDRPMLLAMHDTSWPCGRRDTYYDIASLDAPYPATRRLGLSITSHDLTPWGYGRNENFDMALREGGQRNGVMTALEDVLAANSDWTALHVPAAFGLSIVFPLRGLTSEIEAALQRISDGLEVFAELLASLEYARLTAYDQALKTRFQQRHGGVRRFFKHVGHRLRSGLSGASPASR